MNKAILIVLVSHSGNQRDASRPVSFWDNISYCTAHDIYNPGLHREKQAMDFVNEKIGQYWKAKIEEVTA
jgi:hypothetical protein